MFMYFRFMLALRVQFAGDVNKKISFATTALSNTFAPLFTRAHPLDPELPSAIKYFFNLIHIRLNVFRSDGFA